MCGHRNFQMNFYFKRIGWEPVSGRNVHVVFIKDYDLSWMSVGPLTKLCLS